MIATATELAAVGSYPATDRGAVANRLADFGRVLIVGHRGRIVVYVPITALTMARDALRRPAVAIVPAAS